MRRHVRLAHWKKPCPYAARRAESGLTQPPDMTLPLASRKEAPRPSRRTHAGDGGRAGRVARERGEKARKFCGGGGFIFRVFSPLSRAIPAAKWKDRAIYRVADARVGVWSDEVSITVGG